MRYLSLAWLLLVLCVAPLSAQTLNDPCTSGVKNNAPFSNTVSAVVIPSAGPTRTYLCFVFIGVSGAQNISIAEGTGMACEINQLIIMGGPGATGPASQANGTITMGNGGASIGFTTVAGNDVCLLQSAAGVVAGNMIYVRQ